MLLKKALNNNNGNGNMDTSMNDTVDRGSVLRSQSTGNLTMNRPIGGNLDERKERSPFMRSISRANITSLTNIQMSVLDENSGSNYDL